MTTVDTRCVVWGAKTVAALTIDELFSSLLNPLAIRERI